MATIIASQALISGAFSLTNQAMQLQIFPRMAVVYTSPDAKGQIYMPAINRALCIGSIALVLGFQSSSALSGAYGLAVAGTMSVTTIAFAAVAIHVLGWRPLVVLPLTAAFLFVDVQFLVSNMFKFLHGGYVPVLIAFTLTAIMWTWRSGKLQLRSMDMRFRTKLMPWFVEKVRKVQVADGVHRDPRGVFPGIHRAVVFLCSSRVGPTDPVPLVVRLFLKRLGVVPQHTLLLHISQEPIPRVLDNARRYEIHDLGKGILDQRRPPVELPPSARSTPVGRVSRLGAYVSPPMRIFFADEEWPSLPVYTVKSVTARYGYMEQPHVGIILASLLQEHHEDISPEKWIVEVGEEDAQIASNLGFWHRQRAHLFRILLRQATPAHWYFGLGVDRLVQLTISKTVIPIMLERDGARLVLPMVDLAEPTTIVRS